MVAAAACAPIEDAREREVVAVLTRADEPLLRSRPQLVASKYRAMAGSPFAFFRGSFALYLHDTTGGQVAEASPFFAEVFPFTVGDAHPENFGTLLAADGSLGLEPNDLDAADRYPYLWEVRRLAIGVVLAARGSNPSSGDARAIARASERDYALAAATGYASEIARLGAGGASSRTTGSDGAVLANLFERAAKDAASRDELAQLTTVSGGRRALVRGALDPDDPEQQLVDLPDAARAALPETLEAYRATLPIALPPGFFALKDAARLYGSGVASRPRVRALVLVEGDSAALEDDVILELKEIADSGAPAVAAPAVSADDVGGRIERGLATCWSLRAADPLWGTSTLLGLPVQVRSEREAHKTIRVARLDEELGTPEAIAELAGTLGAVLARVHARSEAEAPGTLGAIARAVGPAPEAFAAEQADVAVRYADVVEADYARFRDALERLGPTLGVASDADDVGDADVVALYGDRAP